METIKAEELERRLTHCDWLVRANAIVDHYGHLTIEQRNRALLDPNHNVKTIARELAGAIKQ